MKKSNIGTAYLGRHLEKPEKRGSFSEQITEPPTSAHIGRASDTPLVGGRGFPSDLGVYRYEYQSRLGPGAVEEAFHSDLDLDTASSDLGLDHTQLLSLDRDIDSSTRG